MKGEEVKDEEVKDPSASGKGKRKWEKPSVVKRSGKLVNEHASGISGLKPTLQISTGIS